MMGEMEARDFFSDAGIVRDPMPYFDALRAQCPVLREPHHGAMMVTGYDEAVQVLSRKGEVFSNCVSVAGPIPPLPFEPEGDDIRAQVEACRAELPWSAHLVSFDGEKHSAHRGLLTKLLTDSRLRANETYLRGLADKLIDRFIDDGGCEVVSQYAHALSTLAIADLLGVPEEDRDALLTALGPAPTQIDGDAAHKIGPDPLVFLGERFDRYIAERREHPRDDLMSELAAARFRDGSSPSVEELARLARFVFGAGQDTSARTIAAAVMILAERPELQARLRTERHRIADFIEEVLRLEAPTKVNFRLAQQTSQVGDVTVPAGSVVTIGLLAANRDPAHFERPDELDIDRKGLRDHLAFSRGVHACPGAPLARMEVRVAIEQLFDRTESIAIDEAKHGPAEDRHYAYEPTYMLRSLSELHVRFVACG